MISEGMVHIGTILRAHGTQGDLVAHIENRKYIRMKPGLHIGTGPEPDRLAIWIIDAVHMMNRDVRLTLAGLSDRESAEKLCGSKVWIHSDHLKPLDEGVYYHYQLIGMTVRTTSGTTVGTITEVMKTGANDVFVVASGSVEHLIPAIPAVIKSVHVSSGTVIIENMTNMLDIQDDTI